jgi:hypothetical protein
MPMHLPPVAIAYLASPEFFRLPASATEWVYMGCAVVGGCVMLLQVVGSLFGADNDGADGVHDIGEDGHATAAGSWLSFRAIVAFLTFFGLGGMVGLSRQLDSLLTLGIGLVCGALALLMTRTVMVQFIKLRSTGTVDIKNAVGAEARVYLTIPASKSGRGSVTVAIQGRTMQFQAITAGIELKTGALCKVSSVHAGDTLLVDALQ